MNLTKNKMTSHNDWCDGVNAYRQSTDREIEVIIQRLHNMEVYFERFKKTHDYLEEWKKRQIKDENKTQGESL